jgi:hypothetical protein
MTRASRSGTALKRIGVTLIVAGLMMPGIMAWPLILYIGMDERRAGLFMSLLMGFLAAGGLFLLWRGRQYAAKADAERIGTDSNPSVLYLRAFRSDPSTARYTFLPGHLGLGLATQEEQLRDALRPFGDLVAIGQPGEGLPKPGAARIYASEEEWKEVVKRQMQAARLVIIRAGVGKNLLWELKQAVETLNPQKVLILVLQMKAKHYEFFRTKANPVLGVSLPEGATLGQFGGFIGFGADWKPSVLPLPRIPYLRSSQFKPYRQLFKFALRPVFESFDVEWQPPPVVFWFNVITALLGLLVGSMVLISILIRFAAQR